MSQHGRPDDGTDATGFFNAEFFVPLKPIDTWPQGVDKAKLTDADDRGVARRNSPASISTSRRYIEDNVEEAASGVKGENSVRVYGNDLATLEKHRGPDQGRHGDGSGHDGSRRANNSLGQLTVRIDVDRARAARYGLAPGDINATVQAAIGGQAAGNLYEDGSDRNFPIIVRLAPEYRGDLAAIRRIAIGAPAANGGTVPIPLADVADVRLVSGAAFIYREQQERYRAHHVFGARP